MWAIFTIVYSACTCTIFQLRRSKLRLVRDVITDAEAGRLDVLVEVALQHEALVASWTPEAL